MNIQTLLYRNKIFDKIENVIDNPKKDLDYELKQYYNYVYRVYYNGNYFKYNINGIYILQCEAEKLLEETKKWMSHK